MNKILKPAILIDLKKPLIRIHKDTLYSIGNPEYILLLVNPKERSFAISASDRTDPKSHHISKGSLVNKKSFELYSTALVKSLQNLCLDWQDDKAYRIYGKKISNKGIVRFDMAEALAINE